MTSEEQRLRRNGTQNVEIRGADLALRELRKSTLHHLPFNIEADGVAHVDAFFVVEKLKNEVSPTVRNAEGKPAELLVSTFRGRKLIGADLALPEDCVGLVLEPRNVGLGSKKKISSNDEKHADEGEVDDTDVWDCHEVFDTITYWNYDQIPCQTDECRRWEEWMEIAKAVHG